MSTTLEQLRAMAALMERQAAEVEAADAALKEAKARLLRTQREDMPAVMQEAGVPALELADGRRIELKDGVDASIPEDQRDAAFAWLEERGFGGLIKTALAADFGKDEAEAAHAGAALLQERFGVEPAVRRTVHPATLKAFVAERMAAGETLPSPPFNVSCYTFADLGKAKGKRGAR